MQLADINSWLHGIKKSPNDASDNLAIFSACDGQQQPDQYLPPSPPDSRNKIRKLAMEDNGEPASKRHKGQPDSDRTPRAPRSRQVKGFPQATGSPGFALLPDSTSQSTQSQASGRSSPSKQLATLEIDPKGIIPRSFTMSDSRLPPNLGQILEDLQDLKDSAFGIISSDWQENITNRAKTEPQMGRIRPYMFAPAADRDKFGPTPSLDDVLILTDEARSCHDRKQNEAGWNMMVHCPLLFKAVYGSRKQSQLLGVAPCTTAKIMQEYLPSASQAKMVDFCIYLDPKSDAMAIENARSILPCGYINHTDFYTLRDQPIALSIETKALTSTSAGSAELQIGTWQSAQWRFLEDLVSRNGGSLDGLSFLPAIIVQGHQWSFAATTREGQRTVLWLPFQFGSTENVLGVYKTVLGLQKICRWVDGVFWPWYRKNALGILEVGG
ncbi:hypothetical protein FPOA_12666 [Fusarium poae]|uniref:PD-(D/E)XK nuclease-like domain-containing protein n=1 Tax=Fusarium poae TaxID=36050 RepID=A0A1B8A8B1_FUSPO|nr:hypothetical protein FPOA_12666 [Fusarium poae]